VERLIVDGYNLIFSDAEYARAAVGDLDGARARLVEDVAAYCRGEARGTVVFDGGGNPESDGSMHHIAGVAVVFSRAGETADSVIESLARRTRERGESAIVVTSDAATQFAVMGGGITRRSSVEFGAVLRAGVRDWRSDAPVEGRKGALQERIAPDVRDALSRWARGGSVHKT
jgi:predicted RNA-binding protein with PIN domain